MEWTLRSAAENFEVKLVLKAKNSMEMNENDIEEGGVGAMSKTDLVS